MPRVCTICTHEQRAAIDAALVAGEPNRRIAAQYSLSEAAIRRHKADHIPAALAKAQAAGDVARADDLLGQVRDLQGRTLSILTAAEGAKDLKLALQAIVQARGNFELLGKLVGELQTAPVVNILVMPEWVRVRGALMSALEPFTEARAAVAGALQELDCDHRA